MRARRRAIPASVIWEGSFTSRRIVYIVPATDLTTIPRVLTRAAEIFYDDEALVDDGERLSFAQLAAAVDDATAALLASGIAPGDRVAIWAPNIAPWVVASLAVHAAGAVL